MMKTCVIHNGQIINIGEWDEQIQPFEVGLREVSPAEYDADGNLIKEAVTEPVYEDRVTNPLPEGAEIVEIDVTQDADGGWVPASDYRRLRKAEYPPIGDQLDAIWKTLNPTAGSPGADMLAIVDAIKTKYPKPGA